MRMYIKVDIDVDYPILINIDDVYFIDKVTVYAVVNKYNDKYIGNITVEKFNTILEILKNNKKD